MIVMEGEILRGSCTPVYFVGETIECEIKFKYTKEKTSNKKKINSEPQLVGKEKDDFSSNNLSDKLQINEINESMFSILSSNSNNDFNFSSHSQLHENSSDTFLIANGNNKSDANFDISNESAQIAWCCVQIDCHCFIDESKVILPKDPLRFNEKTNEISNTSFQPNKDRVGISIYSSKPKILFCNLLLKPNQTKSCKNFNCIEIMLIISLCLFYFKTKVFFKETLPYDLAPTFRGQFAKYAYKVTIGAQKLNKNTQLLRLPFKVYSLLGKLFVKITFKVFLFNNRFEKKRNRKIRFKKCNIK